MRLETFPRSVVRTGLLAMAAIFFLVTLSNALQLEVNADLSSLEMETKKVTFETYEGSKHPVKEVALETALQNVQKLPKEIRAMLTEPNATLPEVSWVSARDLGRAGGRRRFGVLREGLCGVGCLCLLLF